MKDGTEIVNGYSFRVASKIDEPGKKKRRWRDASLECVPTNPSVGLNSVMRRLVNAPSRIRFVTDFQS